MTDAYHNMSVPPRSHGQRQVKPVGNYLVFDLIGVAGAPKWGGEKVLDRWLEDFQRQHANALQTASRPSGYSVALALPRGKALPDGFSLCNNPVLTVAVACRIVGGLYVPRRDLSVDSEIAKSLQALPVHDFPSDTTAEKMP